MDQDRKFDRRKVLLAASMTAVVPPVSALSPAVDRGDSETLDLWPAGAPGGEKVSVREEIIERQPEGPLRDRFAQHVRRPNLTLFKPQAAWNGITLLIVPGGGYVRVVIDKEGLECADWFTRRGFAAAVLRYRMPADGWLAGADAPVHDAMRALRLLRHQHLPVGQARRIGVAGFSAGGHLCGRLITEPALRYPRQDATDEESARPDFAVLVYPVVATTGPAAHGGSANQLRSAGINAAELPRYSPHLNVGAGTPPTLLIHAADDKSVPVENSLLMFDSLRKAGVRSALHVFDSGGHGFGLRGIAGRNAAVWPTLAQNWALSDGPK